MKERLEPKLKIEQWPIERVLPYAKNARLHSPAQVDAIEASIKEFGFINPCLVDADGMLIAGHGRILALKKSGASTVPVIRLGHLNETQSRALRIADNSLPAQATWDAALIQAEIAALRLAGFNIPLLAFPEAQLRGWGISMGTESAEDPEVAPTPPKKPVVRKGDLWVLGDHRLLCGDATSESDVAMCLNGSKPILMVTDPPYGVNYDPGWRTRAGVNVNQKKLGKVQNDNRADWSEAWALFPGAVVYVWHGGLHSGTVEASLAKNKFEIAAQIVWMKDRFALSRGDYHWQHEPCWYAVRKGEKHRWAGNRSQTTTWMIPAREDDGHGHGTQKPIECMKRPIENSSRNGEHIYEPFSGSGTTIIACEMTGRRCLAIELDPGYVQVGIERWEKFTGRKAVLDGKTLDQVAKSRRTGRAVNDDETGDSRKPVPRSNGGRDSGERRLRKAVHARRPSSKRESAGQPPPLAGNT